MWVKVLCGGGGRSGEWGLRCVGGWEEGKWGLRVCGGWVEEEIEETLGNRLKS